MAVLNFLFILLLFRSYQTIRGRKPSEFFPHSRKDSEGTNWGVWAQLARLGSQNSKKLMIKILKKLNDSTPISFKNISLRKCYT